MAVAFRNATSAQGNPLTSQSFALPTIAAGDVVLLFVSWNTAGAVTISGAGTWTHQGTDSVIAGQLEVGLWTAVSSNGSESGQNVTINVAAQEKIAAVAASYSGVDNTTPLQSGPTYAQNTTSNTTSATAPSVSPSPAAWVLEGYASKSSTNASYTTPSGTTSRQQVFGAGAGSTDMALFDTNATTSSGGGQTSTLGTATANKIAVTVVLTTAQVLLADSGSGVDGLTVTATVPLSDAGTGADRMVGTNLVVLSDHGAAADGVAVTATIPLADTGTAADRIAVTATVPLSDHGTAADTLAASIATALGDQGTGVDRLTVAIAVTLSDSGTGVDGIGTAVVLQRVPHGRTFALVVSPPTPFDGGTAFTVMAPGFDGGDAFSTMIDGIDGNFLDVTVGGAGTGRTLTVTVKSGATRGAVLRTGGTDAFVGVAGRTTAISQ